MVWILVWASLLIVVLYSPVGSPDLYSSRIHFYDNQYVVLNKELIHNAPKTIHSSNDNQDEDVLPKFNQETKSIHPVGNFQSKRNVPQESSYSNFQSQSYRSINTGTENLHESGTTVFARGHSRAYEGSSTVVIANGITTLSTTQEVSNSSNKQSISSDQPSGGTDPGGDPVGNPIPVGDDCGVFIFTGLLYALIKLKKMTLFSE